MRTFAPLRFLLECCLACGVLFARIVIAQGVASSADLSSLTLSAGTIVPTFSATTTNYSASVGYPVANITVTAVSVGGSATIQVRINGGTFVNVSSGSPSGALALNVGANTVEIRVTSSNLSNTRTYTVIVTRNVLQPPDVESITAGISGTTTTLNGTVNPQGGPTTAWFEWGLTTNYGTTTPKQGMGSGAASTNFSQTLTGLLGNTYNFRAVASNQVGVALGANQSFTTPPFILGTNLNLPAISYGAVACGDYDNDGWLDFFLMGSTTNSVISQLWRNTGTGFTNVPIAGLPGLLFGSVAWSDYDNDGRLDFLITGRTAQDVGSSQLWRNTGTTFTNVPVAGLPGTTDGATAWGDYDNDGRLDFLLMGTTNGSVFSPLWRNTGSGFVNMAAAVPGLPALQSGSVEWGDYDNDGRLDFFITGATNASIQGFSQLWRNTGNGFTNVPIPGMPGLYNSSAAWGDYDNDGRLDLLLVGRISTSSVSQLWRNTGSGFTNVPIAGLAGISSGTVSWGDYNNDGWLDFLITGESTAQLWRNTGNEFVQETVLGLVGVGQSAMAWGDYDNDGRLDFLSAGLYETGPAESAPITQLWRNNSANTNTPPTASHTLSTTLGASGTITLSWNAATDAETPANALTYNLRVGTTPGGSDLVNPMAANTGQRRLPQLGYARFSRTLSLPPGQAIYWSVQTVDSAFAGSPFAPEKTFAFNTVFTPSNGIPIPGDTSGDGMVSDVELNTVLANYFSTSPWLQMTNVAGLGQTNVTFALTNSFAGAFGVEFTTNFTDWFFLGTAIPRYQFTDTNAPAVPQRSYRLRWP